MRIGLRPNPRRSGSPGWEPTSTPYCLQSATVCTIVSGSLAWKPQATLADVIAGITTASLPIRQLPKLSPRSELMSIVRTNSLSRRQERYYGQSLTGEEHHG